MHPADQFEAFYALSRNGMPNEDIAARFGVTDLVVKKRLKLANVSPVILQAYRNGETDLETLMAFALTDDHAKQEKIWKALGTGDDAWSVRRQLTEDRIDASDKRAKFVTIAAYEKAGGVTHRDLFSADAWLDNEELLNQLAAAKLEKKAGAVRAEGWQWVEVHLSHDWSEWSSCQRRHQEFEPLTQRQQARLNALENEHDQLESAFNDAGEEAEYPQRCHELNRLIEDINRGRNRFWPAETLAIAGAVVSIGYDGKLQIERGYVRRGDLPKEIRTETIHPDGTVGTVPVDPVFTLPASLVETLTAHRSAAITAELIEQPPLAFICVVHALAAQVLYNARSGESALQFTARPENFRRVEGSTAQTAIQAAKNKWADIIPGDPVGLWTWCVAQHQDVLMESAGLLRRSLRRCRFNQGHRLT